MSDPNARLNSALFGRYRIERELGAGGMATVHLAHDERHHASRELCASLRGAAHFLARYVQSGSVTPRTRALDPTVPYHEGELAFPHATRVL